MSDRRQFKSLAEEQTLRRVKSQANIPGEEHVICRVILLSRVCSWPPSGITTVKAGLSVDFNATIVLLAEQLPHDWTWFSMGVVTFASGCQESHWQPELGLNGAKLSFQILNSPHTCGYTSLVCKDDNSESIVCQSA